jgi:hypothetical protein
MQQGRTEVSKAGGRKGVATPFLAKSSRKIFFFDFSTKKKTKFSEAGGALRSTRPPFGTPLRIALRTYEYPHIISLEDLRVQPVKHSYPWFVQSHGDLYDTYDPAIYNPLFPPCDKHIQGVWNVTPYFKLFTTLKEQKRSSWFFHRFEAWAMTFCSRSNIPIDRLIV